MIISLKSRLCGRLSTGLKSAKGLFGSSKVIDEFPAHAGNTGVAANAATTSDTVKVKSLLIFVFSCLLQLISRKTNRERLSLPPRTGYYPTLSHGPSAWRRAASTPAPIMRTVWAASIRTAASSRARSAARLKAGCSPPVQMASQPHPRGSRIQRIPTRSPGSIRP